MRCWLMISILLAPCVAFAQIVTGPWLQAATDTSIVVMWEGAKEVDATFVLDGDGGGSGGCSTGGGGGGGG